MKEQRLLPGYLRSLKLPTMLAQWQEVSRTCTDADAVDGELALGQFGGVADGVARGGWRSSCARGYAGAAAGEARRLARHRQRRAGIHRGCRMWSHRPTADAITPPTDFRLSRSSNFPWSKS